MDSTARAIALGATAAEDPAPPSPAGGPLIRGATLGRYVILSRIGGGGMGVVYAAYDPELDRKVALKLLHPTARGGDAQARLIREAQALAKLSHPNVVAVHDVGLVNGQVFVAMEFVAGTTLTAWIAGAPRTWREMIRLFSRAGEGLVASHAVDVLHRDFKPDNVVVGHDGRVRVIDFGLARAGSDQATRTSEREIAAPNQWFDSPLTATGALLGTPIYMAPEQFDGAAVDVRTDQFSFCVALYEALYGERPFAGSSLVEIADAVGSGRVREAARGSRVPAWVRRVLLRGLSVDPAARHASMAALLAALRRDPARMVRRQVLPLSAGVTILVGALAIQHARQPDPEADVCSGGASELAAIWPERAGAIHTAFTRTGLPYAEHAFKSVSTAFDDYARSWTSMHVEACRATSVRREQSAELLDLRMICLRRRAAELDAQAQIFAQATPETVAKAVEASGSLPSIEDCADVAALRAPIAPPRDPAVRTRVAAARSDLARVRAMTAAGQYAPARALAASLTVGATALDYAPLTASALYQRGRLEHLMGDLAVADVTLDAAEVEALSAHDEPLMTEVLAERIDVATERAKFADSELAARKARALADREAPRYRALVANARGGSARAQGHYDEALAEHRTALVLDEELLGPDHPDVALALYNIANTLYLQGKFADALVAHRRALAIREKVLGPTHPEVARSLNNIATSLRYQGNYEDALAYHRRALAIRERVLGPEHVDVAVSLNNIGSVLERLDQTKLAVDHYRRAVEIFVTTLGPDKPKVAAALDNLANALRTLGQYDVAIGHHRRALAIREKALGPDHPEVGNSLNNLGETLRSKGDFRGARVSYERAFALLSAKLGPTHANVAITLGNLGGALAALGDHTEALAAYRRALEIKTMHLGPDHPSIAYPLTGIGQAQLALHSSRNAVTTLERALAIHTARSDDPSEYAATRFALARALWKTGGDRRRALVLAADARRQYEQAKTPAARRALVSLATWSRDKRFPMRASS